MVESIAATSILGHRPIFGVHPKDCSGKWVTMYPNRLHMVRDQIRVQVGPVKAQAMELTKEAYNFQHEHRIRINPDQNPPKNRADNPLLQNPLLRQERMGCGWLGAIFEWEGVLSEDNPDLEKQSWLTLAQEEGKSPPPAFVLKRIQGMKNEQAISEVLCWSRDPSQLKRMSSRKESIHQKLQGGVHRLRDGSQEFLNVLTHYNIPMALVSTRPRQNLEASVGGTGANGVFAAVVAAEDVYRGKPDPEMFVYAAQLLQFIPERCIVFGNSNLSVEAAHDAKMKCVAVASKHPVYELCAADLIVRRLDELSVVDLKNLADIESPEFEPEVEEEGGSVAVAVDDDDGFW